MDRIVVDTNIIVSAMMNADGAPRAVVRLALEGRTTPVIGAALFAEYEGVLSREALFERCAVDAAARRTLADAFFSACEWTSIWYAWRPNLPDEADNHLVELALAGGAQAIVTADPGLTRGELRFPDLAVLDAGDFMTRWRLR